jgi:hypothetical protein
MYYIYMTVFNRNEANLAPVFRIRDPVLFYPLDPGSGSGMDFFRIPDLGSRIPDPAPFLMKFSYNIFSRDAPDTVFAGYPAGRISGLSKSRIPDIRPDIR